MKTFARAHGPAALGGLIALVGCAQILDIKERTLETGAGTGGQLSGAGGSGGDAGSSAGTTTGGAGGMSSGGKAGESTDQGGKGGATVGKGGSGNVSSSGESGDAGKGGSAANGGTGNNPQGGEAGDMEAGMGGTSGTGPLPECEEASDCPTPTAPLEQCYELDCVSQHCEAVPSTTTCMNASSLSGLCDDGICKVCSADSFKCTGDDLYRCSFAQTDYELAGHCAMDLCDADAKQCNGCAPNTAWCSSDYLTRIACGPDGQPQQPTTNSGRYCIGDGEWVECVLDDHCPPISTACYEKTCANHLCGSKPSQFSTPCSGGSCDGAGKCLICADDQYVCQGATLKKCSSDRTKFDTVSTCTSASLCSVAKERCLVCDPGTLWCDPNDVHTRIKCADDGLSTQPTTDPTKFCTGSGTWVGCRNTNDCTQPTNPCSQAACSGTNTCQTSNRSKGTGCAGTGTCDTGVCLGPPATSCQGNTLTCQGVNCCESRLVQGGSFPMGRGNASSTDACPSSCDSWETPEHTATLSSFFLDTFEVTVGRFRKFYSLYDSGIRTQLDGAGANPRIGASSGWQASAWSPNLLTSQTQLSNALACHASRATWTTAASGSTTEDPAINCVTWYEAFLFCLWDGGRLPTEAEWEYAAASGSLNTLYPWGKTPAPPTADIANYLDTPARTSKLLVGSYTTDKGFFGQYDLGGGLSEYVLDFFDANYYKDGGGNPKPCSNCGNLTDSGSRVLRGSSWGSESLRAAGRMGDVPTTRSIYYGFRCAYDVSP